MLTLLAIVHILIGFALILFVLLQDPKGGALGAFSGGSSSSSFFGASGASNFLSTTTKWLAIAFALSCLALTYLTAGRPGSVMDTYAPPPTTAPAAAQPAAPAQQPAAPADSNPAPQTK